ncbi:MAG: hypothetical protein ACRDQ4_12460 [Pseudonocardiaceae bacterium]
MRGEQRPVSMTEQEARLLTYGFALPPGNPVGRLVTGAQSPEEAEASTPASIPPTAGFQAAAQHPTGGSQMPGGLLPVTLWIGLAVTALAALGALVARQRHRQLASEDEWTSILPSALGMAIIRRQRDLGHDENRTIRHERVTGEK